MNRREFLIRVGGTLIAVPMVLEAVSCGDDKSEWDAQSSEVGGHTHSITVRCSQITGGADVVYTSSPSGGHVHSVTLTVANLNTIAGGSAVTVDGSAASGHFHTWTISKPAGKC